MKWASNILRLGNKSVIALFLVTGFYSQNPRIGEINGLVTGSISLLLKSSH